MRLDWRDTVAAIYVICASVLFFCVGVTVLLSKLRMAEITLNTYAALFSATAAGISAWVAYRNNEDRKTERKLALRNAAGHIYQIISNKIDLSKRDILLFKIQKLRESYDTLTAFILFAPKSARNELDCFETELLSMLSELEDVVNNAQESYKNNPQVKIDYHIGKMRPEIKKFLVQMF